MRTELQPDETGTHFGGPFGRWFFPNGYGASVVNHWGSRGVELAVLYGDKDNWALVYDTPITDDVINYIASPEELSGILWNIQRLPPRGEIK